MNQKGFGKQDATTKVNKAALSTTGETQWCKIRINSDKYQEERNQDCVGVFINVSPHGRPFVLVYYFVVLKVKAAK